MKNEFTHGYALLIGVGISAYHRWSLPVTVKDVQAINAILVDPSLCAYPDNEKHIQLLHDHKATRKAILDGLDWLQKQVNEDPEATAIVYYSGHGWVEQATNAYYLIPHDVEPFDIHGSALSADVFSNAVKAITAKRLLVFIDSCHAEGMATSKGSPEIKLPPNFDESALPESLIATLKQGAGRAIFTSSRGFQRSWIRPDKTMSIYTYHLIEALQGAGNHFGDTVVRISNLMNHIGKTVPESACNFCQVEQTPFFDTATEDFPIALLRGGKGLPSGGWDSVKPEALENIDRIIISGNENVIGDGNVLQVIKADRRAKLDGITQTQRK